MARKKGYTNKKRGRKCYKQQIEKAMAAAKETITKGVSEKVINDLLAVAVISKKILHSTAATTKKMELSFRLDRLKPKKQPHLGDFFQTKSTIQFYGALTKNTHPKCTHVDKIIPPSNMQTVYRCEKMRNITLYQNSVRGRLYVPLNSYIHIHIALVIVDNELAENRRKWAIPNLNIFKTIKGFPNYRLMKFEKYDGPMYGEDIDLRVEYIKKQKPWMIQHIFYDKRNCPGYIQLFIDGSHNLSRIRKSMKICDEYDNKKMLRHIIKRRRFHHKRKLFKYSRNDFGHHANLPFEYGENHNYGYEED